LLHTAINASFLLFPLATILPPMLAFSINIPSLQFPHFFAIVGATNNPPTNNKTPYLSLHNHLKIPNSIIEIFTNQWILFTPKPSLRPASRDIKAKEKVYLPKGS